MSERGTLSLSMPNSACSSAVILRRLSWRTSATSSIYGLSELSSNQSATSSRSTAGAKGRKLSRYLTFRLRFFCIPGERGAEDRTRTKRAWTELHAALEPADGLLGGQRLRRRVDHAGFIKH